MNEFKPFEMSSFPGGLSFRWMQANCYEIKLPNGKTIVTDPFLPSPDVSVELWSRFACGLSVNDLEGGDYALISHSHGDHLCAVPEMFDRFGSLILTHSSSAIHMTTDLMIPQSFVFPYDNGQHYEFEDFTLDTFIGRHYGSGRSKVKRLEKIDVPGLGTEYETLDIYGGMFNTDFLITANNNVRIGFCTGTFPDFARKNMRGARVNLLMRQMGYEIHLDNYQKVAEEMMVTRAELMMPLHHEREYGHADLVAFSDKVNAELASHNYPGRMFVPERARWYKVGTAIEAK